MEGVEQVLSYPIYLLWSRVGGWQPVGQSWLLQALNAVICSRGHPGTSPSAPAGLPSLWSGPHGCRWPLHHDCTHRACGKGQLCLLGWASSPGPVWGGLRDSVGPGRAAGPVLSSPVPGHQEAGLAPWKSPLGQKRP